MDGDPPGTMARVSYLPGVEPQRASTVRFEESPEQDDSTAEAASTAAEPDDAERTKAEVFASARETAAQKKARRAENVSMAALTRRGMSRWELERALLGREFEPEQVQAELERLEGVGLIDDGALADTLVRTQHDRKGLGRSAITAELRRRHIDQEHIDAALEQIDDDGEASRARELAERRAPQLRSYDRATASRRLSAFLMRKGYGSSIVRAAVDEALDETHGGVRFH